MASTATTASVKSMHSLLSIVSRISDELHLQQDAARSLRDWIRTVDASNYHTERPWTREVHDAYLDYKRRVDENAAARRAFYNLRSNGSDTVESHLQRAELAIRWGEIAISAAEGRLAFIRNYRNAYTTKPSVNSHIGEGESVIRSGRRAVLEARENYRLLWDRFRVNGFNYDQVFR